MFEFSSCGSGDSWTAKLYLELLLFILGKILNVKMFNAQSVNAKYALKVLFLVLNSFQGRNCCWTQHLMNNKPVKHLNLFFFPQVFFF